jgi:NadR type nicotinamide-nucleotide adenylyltransferase
MEKRIEIKRVVLTGPESTGKSFLTKALSQHFNEPYIFEIARDYVENLNREYTYQDLEIIAEMQIKAEEKALKNAKEWLFIDTDLIITKVWFKHVFGKAPEWLDKKIQITPRYIHLLCNYDIPWVPDPVRENPDKRNFFFDWYKQEIINYGFKFSIISGNNSLRIKNAICALQA